MSNTYGMYHTQFRGVENYLESIALEPLDTKTVELIMVEFLSTVNPVLPKRKKGKRGSRIYLQKLANSVQNKWGLFVKFIEQNKSSYVKHKETFNNL